MIDAANRETAALYLRENFDPDDRLALVLIDKSVGAVIQRLAPAETMASADFMDWAAGYNGRHFDVYVSMNALKSGARSRTKSDVAAIRHVYLDFDEEGTRAVEAMLKRPDLPKPNYLLNTSPDKWQAVWKVQGFGQRQSEELQRGLARECGADPAATDSTRVLRLPGFVNQKYAVPHLVEVQALTKTTYGPAAFPAIRPGELARGERMARRGVLEKNGHGLSQSERDWAFAKRALARGESPPLVVAAIAQYRRQDKHDPNYYAELTVLKASESLKTQSARIDVPGRI